MAVQNIKMQAKRYTAIPKNIDETSRTSYKLVKLLNTTSVIPSIK